MAGRKQPPRTRPLSTRRNGGARALAEATASRGRGGRERPDIARSPSLWLGVYHRRPPREGRGEAGEVVSTDGHVRHPWRVPPGKDGGAESGDLVVAEPFGRGGVHGQAVRVSARLGRFDSPGALNAIAVRTFDLPSKFSAAALTEAAAAGALEPDAREDLRDLPLVTIDGEDARDFDDAVFAEPLAQGFRIIVAIADVAHYVRPGSALDEAARARGNSVYLPGLVLPMLPPPLSEHWCSLVPGEDRGVLFAEIVIDENGRELRHRFALGVMRSRARLTYQFVQEAWDGDGDGGLPGRTLAALRAAWQALDRARKARGALEIELPERHVVLNSRGQVSAVLPEPRFESHRLIEELMIAANVAAAEELMEHHLPGLFRVHAPPSPEALVSLTASLKEIGVPLAKRPLSASTLGDALESLARSENVALASACVLRALPQAGYSAQNTGHFGLALPAYAHFTSPIRRYADLLVHRALLRRLEPEEPASRQQAVPSLDEMAEFLSLTERRAAEAERSVLMRAQALLLAKSSGAVFEGWISGVTRSVLFVALAENGAEGVIPISSLGRDIWRLDARANRLSGLRSGREYRLGSPVTVRLAEADPITGRLAFRLYARARSEPKLSREGTQSRPR